MTAKSSDQRWGSIARFFHWTIATAIVVMGALGLTMVNLPKRPNIIPLYTFHKSLGLTILLLAALRLLWRLFDRRPADPTMPNWQLWASRIVHGLLYVLIFAIPLSGWLFDSVSALRPLFWFGLFHVPSLTGGPIPDAKALAHLLHKGLFWLLVAALVLHVGGALKHHFGERDNVLARMLPWRTRRLSVPSKPAD